MRRGRDHREWPHVPEGDLLLLQADAEEELRSSMTERGRQVATLTGVEPEQRHIGAWARSMVELATAQLGDLESQDEARRRLIRWFTPVHRSVPDERWWWSACGVIVSAWEDDGLTTRRTQGAVPTWLPVSTIARHLPVTDRTVRRWGENRQRVRQRGSETAGRTKRLHRGDVAKLLVMRWGQVFR